MGTTRAGEIQLNHLYFFWERLIITWYIDFLTELEQFAVGMMPSLDHNKYNTYTYTYLIISRCPKKKKKFWPVNVH